MTVAEEEEEEVKKKKKIKKKKWEEEKGAAPRLPAAPPDLAGDGRRRPGRPWAAGRPLACTERVGERRGEREN